MQAKLEALQAQLKEARDSADYRAEIRIEDKIEALLEAPRGGRGLGEVTDGRYYR